MKNSQDFRSLELMLREYGHNGHSHLYFSGDKRLFWAKSGKAVIVYRDYHNRSVVLGDPIGEPEDVSALIGEFANACKKQRRIPVFYQVKTALLQDYRNSGLNLVKLGEEARIDLEGFHTNGKAWVKLRTRVNKFERNGCRLEVLRPPFAPDFMAELAAISAEWLGKRKEKSFSVGAFSEKYVRRFPIAVLREEDGSIVAFATLGGGEHRPSELADPASAHLTIDLMRHRASCAHGTMDVLFILLLHWAKQAGYRECSLGMAPLANAGESTIARLIYKYGNRFYNFKGLYEYKNKFGPQWDDVFVAAPAGSMPVTMLLLALMINKGKANHAGALAAEPAAILTMPENRVVAEIGEMQTFR
ncbi:phosphatidylglycerol lysyltransferase domain-containing protein [Paenibacillus xanthanilyticus]|uniref:Phosphatidylglycerol lysyltransferase domain-containing protein n=1 Tax=Paenibacillus xanthanilyticus TaxID=1783531 RepID=A0ABV8K7N2_9BACL